MTITFRLWKLFITYSDCSFSKKKKKNPLALLSCIFQTCAAQREFTSCRSGSALMLLSVFTGGEQVTVHSLRNLTCLDWGQGFTRSISYSKGIVFFRKRTFRLNTVNMNIFLCPGIRNGVICPGQGGPWLQGPSGDCAGRGHQHWEQMGQRVLEPPGRKGYIQRYDYKIRHLR